jgi:hypothetical protein
LSSSSSMMMMMMMMMMMHTDLLEWMTLTIMSRQAGSKNRNKGVTSRKT